MNYFNKLPLINYNNNIAVNLLARAKLSDNIKTNKSVLLPYTMADSDRADVLSRAYYGTSGYSWLVWFSNEVVDPYYDLPLSENDLLSFISTKYGSLELAQRKIKHYRTNGSNDDTVLSTSEYNSLPQGKQKYWEPVLDYLFNIKNYKRKSDEQIVNTNRIGSITYTNLNGIFKIGEEIQYNGTNYGFCTSIENNTISVNNMTGQFTANTTITGKESNATATIVNCNNAVITTIAYTDQRYWEPLSYFDYEVEENEKKKEILLVDARYRTQIEQDLKRTLNNI